MSNFKVTKVGAYSALTALCVVFALGWVSTQPQAYVGVVAGLLSFVFGAMAGIAHEDSLKSDF
jgi:uncharacterized membrane protein (DUF4010 family)